MIDIESEQDNDCKFNEKKILSKFFGLTTAIEFIDDYVLTGHGNYLKIYDFHSTKLIIEQKVFLNNKITKIKIFDFKQSQKGEKLVILMGENKLSYFYWSAHFINNLNASVEKIPINNLFLGIKLEYKEDIYNKLNIEELNNILNKTNEKLFNLSPKYKTDTSLSGKLNNKKELNSLCNNDMILDCLFIPEKHLIALGTVNNYILLYKTNFEENHVLKLTYLTKFFCPEKCIVYSMSLKKLNDNFDDGKQTVILVASGTVFRKIVYWKININFNSNECQGISKKDEGEIIDFKKSSAVKILDLKGHEGVVFNLEIISPQKIISVSDDRTCKVWNLSMNSNNEYEFSPEKYSFESLIDHNARVWSFIYDPNSLILATVSEDNTAKIYKEKMTLGSNLIGEEKEKSFVLVKTLEGHIGKNIRTINIKRDFIFTSAEDGQLIKWDLKGLLSQEHIKMAESKDKNQNTLLESYEHKVEKKQNNNKTSEDCPNDHDDLTSNLNFSYSLSNEDSQFLLAKKTQKNFSSCVKCLKIIDFALLQNNSLSELQVNQNSSKFNSPSPVETKEENYGVLIGSNHGDLIYCKMNKGKNILETKKIFSDENCRVVNSILYVYETRTILVGLSDGVLLLIKFDPLVDFNEQKIEAKHLNVFAGRKIRITFLYYEVFAGSDKNSKNAIFVISNPIAENVIFLFDDFKENEETFVENFLEKFTQNAGNYLTIHTFVKEKLPTSSLAIKKLKDNEFIIFFGDFNGIVYHTVVKKIGQRLYNYNELKYFLAHEKEKVSKMLIQKDKFKLQNFQTMKKNKNEKPQENPKEVETRGNGNKIFYLYTCGRDGSFKKFTVKKNQNTNPNNAFNLKEKDFSLFLKESKNFYSLTSLEDFFVIENKDENFNAREIANKFSENIYFAGHYGRYLCLYDLNNNLNFHSKEIKGVHRPFDVIMKNEEILYTYSNAEKTEIFRIAYNKSLSSIKSLYQPLHGRLIHNLIVKNLTEKFDLIITASEDTKINFYLFSKKTKNLEFLTQSSKHSGAIREILILSKSKKKNFDKKTKKKFLMFDYYIYSVGALSQSFINKFFILFDEEGNFLSQDLEFVCDMTFDNHLKCAGMPYDAEKFKDLSYFQNIKKEKLENIETRIMGVAKIEICKGDFGKNFSGKRCFFTCAINSLGHCEMGLIAIREENDLIGIKDKNYYGVNEGNSNNNAEFQIYKKCRLLKYNQFIGLSVKIINIPTESDNEDLAYDYNEKENSGVNKNVFSVFSKENLFMIIGLTNGNLLIVRIDESESDCKAPLDKIDFTEKIFKIHEAGINEVQINKKNNLIATCGEDYTIAILKYTYLINKDKKFELDLNVINKICYPHQAPIKSLKFLTDKRSVYLIAGSYDQVISISKLNLEEKGNVKILTKKLFINLAELNGIHGYYHMADGKIIIYAIGQGLEYYEFLFD